MPPRARPDVDDPLHPRTAWHPLLILLLERLLPRELWEVLSEFTLTREPRRIDAVIVRRECELHWQSSHLRSVLDDLHEHNGGGPHPPTPFSRRGSGRRRGV